MATVEKFEDLFCWQRARELTKYVYQAFRSCGDPGFKDQIQRASVSVMSNIAEGFERGTQAEFVNYLFIAKGSAGEVRSQLYAAFDINYLNIERFKYLNNLAVECSRLIQSFATKLKMEDRRGSQFKKVYKKEETPEEFLKKYAPEHYEKIYGGKV